MVLIKDYISENGAHIKVYDDALDNSPENRAKIYGNLSRIVTDILVQEYERKHGTKASK